MPDAADPSGVTQLSREMGCTRAEFERWLPGAIRHAAIESAGNLHRVSTGAGIVEIHLDLRPPRRIASVELPVLAVTFRFLGMSEAARRDFLAYFDHYTRRGGG
ncbi:hypothetical protein SAMN06265795_102157 [Noviherbaspirillum humi]|uniref:Uncharacterized protein n=1 Tax=Noviherbaspirillum humi TaxID=1688639 RepID=A0A239DF47_9BURK|nr:hypothetical protein [Noviherbaspirillum humi]SNS31106.1 hypothetical protein SAMN06265795_102157 [Noviherbaspirillum humi]